MILVSKQSKISFCLFAAFLQGLCLVTLPAASIVFKSSKFHAITDQQYGISFIPQVLLAILCTYFVAGWLGRHSRKQLLLVGIICSVLQLFCAAALRWTVNDSLTSFVLLLCSNAFLGAGFGLTVSILNIAMIDLEPNKESAALAGLHALIGTGAGLGPILIGMLHHKTGDWTMAPILTAIFWLLLLGIYLSGDLSSEKSELAQPSEMTAVESGHPGTIPFGAFLFLLSLILYGVVEAMMGNWAMTYAHQIKGLQIPAAAIGLSAFWFFLTLGRLASTYVATRVNPRKIYWIFPAVMILGLSFLLMAHTKTLLILAHAFIGLGCSAFFPLTLGISIHEYPSFKERLSSLGLTTLMIGVGLGSSVMGFLRDQGVLSLHQGFIAALLISVLLFFRSLHVKGN